MRERVAYKSGLPNSQQPFINVHTKLKSLQPPHA